MSLFPSLLIWSDLLCEWIQNLPIVNSVVIILLHKYFCDMLTWSLWGKYPGMVSLGHIEDPVLVSWETSMIFIMTGLSYISHQKSIKVPRLRPCESLLLLVFLMTHILAGKMESQCSVYVRFSDS